MALKTGSISANGSKGHHKFTLSITENSTNQSNNTSSITYQFKISPVISSYSWSQQGTNIGYTIKINNTNYTGTIPNYDGTSTVTLKTGTVNINHDSDGKKLFITALA